MTSVMIRVPLEVKEQLEERAAGRPIHKMLSQDFLHEPDTLTLVDKKFNILEQRIDERLAGIEDILKWLAFQLSKTQRKLDNLINDLDEVPEVHKVFMPDIKPEDFKDDELSPDEIELADLYFQAERQFGSKFTECGIDNWTVDMLRQVLDDSSLLDNREWIAKFQMNMPWEL